MKLQKFIEDTVIDILKATEKVTEETKKTVRLTGPQGQERKINFDIAVTAGDEKDASAGIQVWSMVTAKAAAKLKQTNQQVSRIYFEIEIPNA